MLTRLSLVAVIAATFVAVPAAHSDLDAFMAQVLAQRDENWKKLQQYILDEEETVQVTGPGGARLYGSNREFRWFPRDGLFIRSPLRADGVAIGEPERRRAEEKWVREEQRREERRSRGASSGAANEPDAAASDRPQAETNDTVTPGVFIRDGAQALEPRFVSTAYFMKFRFEAGHYALAGRETLLDRQVLRIEYYPARLFSDDDRQKERSEGGGRTPETGRASEPSKADKEGQRIERQMNKVSFVTLWVEPTAHQILQYEFNNIDMDFLPGRSMMRLEELRASMRMTQPFPDVWLPDTIGMRFRMTLAIGDVAARYDVRYHDYRLAGVTAIVR